MLCTSTGWKERGIGRRRECGFEVEEDILSADWNMWSGGEKQEAQAIDVSRNRPGSI